MDRGRDPFFFPRRFGTSRILPDFCRRCFRAGSDVSGGLGRLFSGDGLEPNGESIDRVVSDSGDMPARRADEGS